MMDRIFRKRTGEVLAAFLIFVAVMAALSAVAWGAESLYYEEDLEERGVLAEDAGSFLDNEHWIEVSTEEMQQKIDRGDPFIAIVYRENCLSSMMKSVLMDRWMNEYGIDLYGLNCDLYTVPREIWNGFEGSTKGGALPFISLVDPGNTKTFTGDTEMKVLQSEVQGFLGIQDEAELSFRKLNEWTYQQYNADPKAIEYKYLADPSDIPESIRLLTEEITANCTTDYEKLKAIYDWVSDNIYYDMEALSNGTSVPTSAEATYRLRRSVCSGYSNLTEAMCLAAGIPCRVASGYGAGIGTGSVGDRVWEIYTDYLRTEDLDSFFNEISYYENHAWNEAFVEGRWVILDTTWGSGNKIYVTAGEEVTGTRSDRYFDPDLEWFSESHLFWEEPILTYTFGRRDEITWKYYDRSEVIEVNGPISEKEPVFLAEYDANGKMLSIGTFTASGDRSPVSYGSKIRKLFWVGETGAPLCRNLSVWRENEYFVISK